MNEEMDKQEIDLSSRRVSPLGDKEQVVFTLLLDKDADKQLYALEKSHMAVNELATGRGNLKDRLAHAFTELIRIEVSVLPANLQSDYQWIMDSLTSKPAKQRAYVNGRWIEGVEGRIGATLAYMRRKKAEEIARRIYDFDSQLKAVVES